MAVKYTVRMNHYMWYFAFFALRLTKAKYYDSHIYLRQLKFVAIHPKSIIVLVGWCPVFCFFSLILSPNWPSLCRCRRHHPHCHSYRFVSIRFIWIHWCWYNIQFDTDERKITIIYTHTNFTYVYIISLRLTSSALILSYTQINNWYLYHTASVHVVTFYKP